MLYAPPGGGAHVTVNDEQIADHDVSSWRVVARGGGQSLPGLLHAALEVLQELERLEGRGSVGIELADRRAQLLVDGGAREETHLVTRLDLEPFGYQVAAELEGLEDLLGAPDHGGRKAGDLRGVNAEAPVAGAGHDLAQEHDAAFHSRIAIFKFTRRG